MPYFGKLDMYGMKNRSIRYLWILKLKIKYMPFPRFRELIMDFAHFYLFLIKAKFVDTF